MTLASGGDRELVLLRHLLRAKQDARDTAAPIVQLHGQHLFERGADETRGRKRLTAEYEQSASTNGKRSRWPRELDAGEGVAVDIGENERVVAEQVFTPDWKSARQGSRTSGSCLHEERVMTLAVLPLAHNGIDLETRIEHPGAFDEAVLKTGRAFDDEEAPHFLPDGLTSTLRVLFSPPPLAHPRGSRRCRPSAPAHPAPR